MNKSESDINNMVANTLGTSFFSVFLLIKTTGNVMAGLILILNS